MPKPTTTRLAGGQLNRSDQIEVQLHRPATEPAVVLIVWPAAPSVVTPNPRALAAVAAAVVRVLVEAQTRLRGDHRTR
jgi:hypothetical protein